MRLIKRIPHDRFLIELHQYNGKYLLKLSLDHYEQIYKIPEDQLENTDFFNELINASFLKSCLNRFISMRSDFLNQLKQYNNE
tara:strand:- start:235 stop:483 length:249 start_codon:yes stop_codon:yes gene_type:complete